MHKLVSNKLFNFLFTFGLIMVVLNFQNGHFFVAKAFNNKVNIIPGNFSLAQNDGSEMRWEKIENAFNQDLNEDSEFYEFDINNSAYIVYKGNNDTNSEEDDFEKVELENELPTESSGGSSSGGGQTSVNEDQPDASEEDGVEDLEVEEIHNEDTDADDTDTDDEQLIEEDQTPATEEDQEPATEDETTVKGIDNTSELENQDDSEIINSEMEVSDLNDDDAVEEEESEEIDDEDAVILSETKNPDNQSDDHEILHSVQDDKGDEELKAEGGSDESSESSESSGSKESSDDSSPAPAEKDNDDGEVSLIEKIFSPIKSFISALTPGNVLKTREAIAQNDYLSQELIFSDFFVPISMSVDDVGAVTLKLSLASASEFENDSLKIEYSTDDQWSELEEVMIDQELSNVNTFGYFSYQLPDDIGLDSIGNLRIRLTYINPSYLEEKTIELYLDALWLELEYDDDTIVDEEILEEELDEEVEDRLVMIEGENFDLNQLSEKFDFQVGELPKFNFKFTKKKKILKKLLSAITEVFYDEYEEMRIDARILEFGSKNNELPVDVDVKYIEDGEFEIELGELPRQFKPGKYSIEIVINDNGETFSSEKDFTWGVLAINFNKTIYLEDETAYVQMAVLTDTGDTICDARLVLEIESPEGDIEILSTDEGGVLYSGKCGPNNVIDVPDYFTYYNTSALGTYQVTLTAYTENGEREITDSFELRRSVLIDVERIGPTRIYPWADYEMKFVITPNVDYVGEFHEYIPKGFEIAEQKQDGRVLNDYNEENIIEKSLEKEIIWQVDWIAGKEYVLAYTMDPPNISPEYYLLGPAKATGLVYWEDEEENVIEPEAIDFEETRQWQIASDDQTIFSTEGADTFDVPVGVSSITAKVWGAGGGGGGGGNEANVDGGGGAGGGFAQGTMNVTAGETLNIRVGGEGYGGNDSTNEGEGGGGGGYSGVLRGTTMLIQAGGGGGGGGGGRRAANNNDGGGAGGGSGSDANDGFSGLVNCGTGGGDYGEGATTGSFGVGGSGCGSGGDGDDGDTDGTYEGGDGGDGAGGVGNANEGIGGTFGGGRGGDDDSNQEGGGGGGGGGYHGGGGGEAGESADGGGGAGGGSGYTTGLTAVTTGTGGYGTTGGAGGIAANNGDSDYAGGAGDGGDGGVGNNTLDGYDGSPGRIVLIYTPAVAVMVSATGTQISTANLPSSDNYIGGSFVLTENIATSTVTSITITESGTVDAQTGLSNIKLFYDLDSSSPYDCASESYASGDAQFGSTQANFDSANGTSTFNGSVEINITESMCVYVVLDVDLDASKNETIEIEIDNPAVDVVLGSGSVGPATSIEISGSTSLYSPDVIVSANEQRESDAFTAIANQEWTNESQVVLSSYAKESGATTTKFDYYFELANENGTFNTTTSTPASPCLSGAAFGTCTSKIWTASASTTDWYDTAWVYRKKITINAAQVYTTETAFVVLATTTDSDFADTSNGGHVASASGDDIIIIDDDGLTVLDYEREYYDNTTGELVIWVETDISSTSNKTFYLYYGNSSVGSDQQNIVGTWDGDYTLVNHLNDDPGPGGAGDLEDSTSNSNDATAAGGMTSADLISAKLGLGIDFDGVSDVLTVPDSGSMDGSTGAGQARTYSYWLNFTTVNANTLITDKSPFSGNGLWSEAQVSPNKIRGGTDSGNQLVSNTTFVTNRWYYVVFEHDGSFDRLYVDGTLDAGPNAQTADSDNNNEWRIMGSGNSYEVNGKLDELRVTNVSHSASWIKTEFNNQGDVSSFLNFNPEESIAGASYEATVDISSIPDRGSSTDSTLGYKWQVIACNDKSSCSFWDNFNSSIPNFKVDTSAPSAPGSLTLSTTTATAISLNFGAQTSDINFAYYKIFYKDGISGVDAFDISHNDTNLNIIDYNGAASTTIYNLEPDTQYVINIWAYDLSGNKTGATEISVTTKTAAHARARSVMFFAGNYSGNGTDGQLTDTDQTFSTFNFSLAETGIDVRSAYVLFEAQIAAYHENSGDYSGYNLAFDVCQESCAADAFSGSGRILKDDNTPLVFSETESDQLRLLLDVTEELELAAYLGDSTNLEAQVGYNIETGTATSSIANAKATLIVTYSFDDDNSTNITNTVIYPLESTAVGDSGTRLSGQVDYCTKDSDCPLFTYNMDIPEFSTSLSQWFQVYNQNDSHGGEDVAININIEGTNIDSNTYIHESFNGSTQGAIPQMIFSSISGFSENTDQTLEYYSTSPGDGNYYLMGGEVVETYTALKSASIKTRTVSFPIGIITNGQSVSTASNTVDVYFSENGSGFGVVDVQKAWFRIVIDNYNGGAFTTTVSSEVGDNGVSGNYVYNYNASGISIKPSSNIIHVIPLGDYEELEEANASTPKTVVINTTNSTTDTGGVSAELMVTYTYTSEAVGYLTSLNLFGGQTEEDGNATNTSVLISNSVFPELKGTKTVRSSALAASFLMSDSDGEMPGAWYTMDVNVATTSPVCVNAFNHRDDGRNSFTEFYRDVTSSILVTDDQSYSACYSNDNASDDTVGAKMNSIWLYTYTWEAPPTNLTQNDWRFYENIDDTEPTVAKAAEGVSINRVNIGDVVRLRMNIGVTKTDLATSTQSFKLQFAQSSDCAGAATSSWADVGDVSGSEAWLGYNNPDPSDNSTLTSVLLASSTAAESYEESNSSASNPRAILAGGYGEWDWVIYNNSATSSVDYCFRMIKNDNSVFTDYLSDSYPNLLTAPSNTAPSVPNSLEQYRSDNVTVISNASWINNNDILLTAAATDLNIDEVVSLYFELIPNSSNFITATTAPVGACLYATAYEDCASKVWLATSTIGDYRTDAYVATTSIIDISTTTTNYKWQVLSCDDDGACSSWVKPGANPNIRIDMTPPTAPGDLSFSDVGATNLDVVYGASTTEDYFVEYKIFYKVGSQDVTELDIELNNGDLDFQDYNNATSTSANALSANTEYVFNIWAYDIAGNTASATIEVSTTTVASYNPPSGFVDNLSSEKTNGSGIVDMVILVDDPDNDDTLRAKVFYEAGDTCAFASETNMTVDEADISTTATYGDPDVDNAEDYQVGVVTNWIQTSPGSNYIFFDWESGVDIPTANGDYCIGLVVNDGMFDQVATHTKVMTIDNVDPTAPGILSTSTKSYDSITLAFGTESADTRFDAYKIFYKEGISGVTESDNEFNIVDDPNLDLANYGTAATTTILGLNPNTTYVFNIWAYDVYGNKASSTEEFTIKTNAQPVNISADNQYHADGTTVISNGVWIDDDDVIFSASVNDQDAGDLMSFYFELITATGTFSSLTVPPPVTCASGTAFSACLDNIWLSTTTVSNLPADWYSEDWLYRKKITIDSSKVLADETNFSVLVETTDSDLVNYARSDGFDILFTDSSGTTILDYEREYYDYSTGELVAWVEADISSTTDTDIYIYYGNSGATIDSAVTAGAWDSDYMGIWHLSENVVDDSSQVDVHEDSTINDNDGDQYGNNEKVGMFYQGQDFDGVNDYIEIDDDNSLDMIDALSLGFWIKGTLTNPPSASTSIYASAGTDSFVVPDGVTEISVKVWGGGGGGGAGIDGGGSQNVNNGGHGGGGGFVGGTISVTPGETLDILVGGGGGSGQVGASSNGGGGGGGGGRSEIERSSTPLLMASGGGGGGGGNDRTYAAGADGGAGGGLIGIDGADSGTAVGGGGASQASGGTAGTGANNAQAGASEVGGDGADGRSGQGVDGSGASGGVGGGGDGGLGDVTSRYPGGGGGGGGYFGGGGGGEQSSNYNAGAGAGGGSSYISAIVNATSTESGSGRVAGNNSDEDYNNNVGYGGGGGSPGTAGIAGVDGYVIISFSPGLNIVEKGNAYKISLTHDGTVISGMINGQAISTSFSDTWHYVTLTYDRNAGGNDELKLYIDSILSNTADFSDAINTNSSPIIIGDLFDGVFDEFRISDIARSSDWIKTEYNNQSNVNNFLSFSSQSTVTSYFESVLSVNIPDNPDYSTGYKWQVMACDDDNDCSSWDAFDVSTPNFMIDTTDPSAPGALTEGVKTSNTVTLNFGTQTDEDNFSEYKIFYSTNSPVTEADFLRASSSEPDLGFVDYNSTTDTTVIGLSPDTTYYFNIWAYDIMGHKASSTITSIVTGSASSTPGVFFYSKNDRAIYYNIWDGADWGGEQSSGNITAVGDNIRHIRTVRSDDGGRIGILFKTWDGTNQEWWGTVYRFAADDFVNSLQLGNSYAAVTNNQLITACIFSLSGGEFVVARNNNGSDGSLIYSWSGVDGWTTEAAGPSPGAVLNGCEFVRRPDTDNYILMTYDDDADVGSTYYYGGSTYTNSWTSWTEHSTDEEDLDNYVGQAFFDSSDNTRGAIVYSNSTTNDNAIGKYFIAGDSTLNFGAAVNSPTAGSDDWSDDFVHGEFAVDPTGTGIAYYSGRDISGQLNTYKVDVTNPTLTWSTVTNGDNISSGDLYSETNYSQKPFASTFYKGGKGLLLYNSATAPSSPYYSVITSSGNTMSATGTVPGADANLWSRVRLYNDPYEYEAIAIYQNDDVDYSAVFWNGGADQFYSSGNQAWTELVTNAGTSEDDEVTSFAFTGFNTPPNSPSSLVQYKTDASSIIVNQGWTNETTVKFEIKANDIDTYEMITLYLNLAIDSASLSSAATEDLFNACASTTPFDSCGSKIWAIASSSLGDYSAVPYTATATITSIASSTVGYKWQAIACDDEGDCSSWETYNNTQPNFYVDDKLPTVPGDLTDSSVNSNSVTLQFGSATVEDNFSEYIIFYKIGSSGVNESDSSWTQADDNHLSNRLFDGFSETIITGLSSSTQYVFNIWAYDLAGNRASAAIEVSTTTSALPNLAQTSYLLENDDGADVDSNSAEVAVDTALNGVYVGERINARIQMENNGGDTFANKVYKLQFENNSDSPGTWIDVGESTEISYSSGLSDIGGDQITSDEAAANSNSWIDGAWHEDTNVTDSFSLTNGFFTEFVFAIETSNALEGDTYRLRLYNDTDTETLNSYNNYPTLTITGTNNKRYSKNMLGSLPADTNSLLYYLDPLGYSDLLIDDDSDRDEITSSSEYPVISFATKHTNSTDSASSTWNGQSSIAPSVNNIVLQIYRFGSTNDWISVSTNSSAAANTDFDLAANINSNVSEYYDGSDWIYWRVYQESGNQNLKTDYFGANFSAPTPVVEQIHYRWRNDDGSESLATWLEAEDTGSPTLGAAFGIGSSSRLRLAVTNSGSGSATNYRYRLEYASSNDGCVTDFGTWTTVPINDTTEHFEMVASSNFSDGDPTTEQFINSESYTFVAGDIVEDPSNITGNISLTEDRYTEVEYMIEATSNAQIAGTYCFRTTNIGTVLNVYDVYPVLTIGGSTNAAPAFSVSPTDNGSAVTSPTNYNSNVSFNATAGDSEGDSYYLAICKSDAILPGSDSAPVCTGGDWCISGETVSTAEASCDYNATSSSESLDWYAFVCDKQPGFGIAKCSASSQGSGSADDNSPFAVNHPPDFTSVVTTVNNINPGGTTTITAYVTDNDIAGSADTMDMFVCTQNNAVAGVGCAGFGNVELCSELATSSPNAMCDYSTTTPATAGDWTYYTFVFDSHNLAAIDNSRSATYTINDTVPVLGGIVFNNGNDITLNIKGAADTSVSLVNTSVVDLNGCNSIVSAVGAIYMSNATNGYNCSADDNDCYQVTVGNCVQSECDSPTDITATYTCTADMKYFAVPTDDSTGNPNESYGWMSYLRVYDGANYSDPATSSKVELMTGSGIEVVENEISFGFWNVGDNTGNTNSTSTIVNISNSPIDSNISGTNMIGSPSGSISVDKIKWSLSGFNYVFDGTPLSGAGIKVEILSPRATTTMSDVEDEIYWGIGIPLDADSSAYAGVNTFSVVLDIDDW
jgi:hypothetical protein